MSADIGNILKNAKRGSTVTLPPGCYEGNFIVPVPCTVIGDDVTLWSGKGITLTVKRPNTELRGLRIISASSDNALKVSRNTVLSGVEVIGAVTGKCRDAVSIGNAIALGRINADGDNNFRISVNSERDGIITSRSPSVTLSDTVIHRGQNDLTLTVSGVQPDSLLMAELEIKTEVIRTVYITGRIV